MSPVLVPVFVSLDGASVVVTGSGASARQVSARLSAAGAKVVPAGSGAAASLLDGALLLVTASDEPAGDATILEEARRRGLLTVSALGAPGRAFLGACEERDGLAVAVTSRGQSPVLEARLAAAAVRCIEPQHGRLAEILGGIRAKLEARIPDDATREAIWEQILDSPVALLLQAGSDDEAIEMAERMAWGTG